jgi:predicted DNA binding CopG/RHH family protein
VRFPSETIERVKDVAGAEGVTVSAWIRRAIDEKLHRLAEERPDSGG